MGEDAPTRRNLWTLRGDRIDVSSCHTLQDTKETAARHLGLPPEELLLLCGREPLNETNFRHTTTDLLRVVHRPPPPTRMLVRYVLIAAWFCFHNWWKLVWNSIPAVLCTLLVCACLRWLPRRGWQVLAPVPPPRDNGCCPGQHLVVVPLYNETDGLLEPMLASLVRARRSWDLTVLFAAEQCASEMWIRKAAHRLSKAGIPAVAVRHPGRLLHEVPGAASNLNWALEIFCFECQHHHHQNHSSPSSSDDYLLTKCDSNGVVDPGYLEEVETVAQAFGNRAFFAQSPFRWKYKRWSRYDAWIQHQINRIWDLGEGGMAHFSFPLCQFVAAGGYSHASLSVLDDTDCYLQQEALGVHAVLTESAIVKCHEDAHSDMGERFLYKWAPGVIHNVLVEPTWRRIVYSYRMGLAVILPYEIVACGLKLGWLWKQQPPMADDDDALVGSCLAVLLSIVWVHAIVRFLSL